MPETERQPAPAGGQYLCAAQELAERGDAVVFDILLWRQPARAFALRIDQRPVAYVNRCVHVPTELDWQPGKFLDDARETIVCAVHGAMYAPATGRCVGGPCGRGRLMPVEIRESADEVYWYPSPDVQPVPAASPNPTSPP